MVECLPEHRRGPGVLYVTRGGEGREETLKTHVNTVTL
jgi:hypothetical protein